MTGRVNGERAKSRATRAGLGPSEERAFYGTEAYTLGQLGALISRVNLGGDGALTDEYAQSVWVYACARVRANAVASAPFELWTSMLDDAAKIEAGPLVDALAHPNPWMSSRRLWWLTQIFKDLDGECLWTFWDVQGGQLVPMREGGIPREIYPYRGSQVGVEYDAATGMPSKYRISSTHQEGAIPAHAGLFFVDPDPADWRRGFATSEALTRLLDIDFQLDRYDAEMAKRGGVPSVAWASDTPLTDTQAKQARERIDDRMSGIANAGKPLVLGAGIKPIQLGQTAADMGHPARRTWNRDAIMAAYGVTKPLIGVTDDVNRANAREARAVFWEGTMPSVIRDLEDDFQERFLRTRRGPERTWAAAFNLGEVEALSDSLDSKIARTQLIVAMGVPFATATKLANWDIDEDLLAEIPKPPPAPGVAPDAEGDAPEPEPEPSADAPADDEDRAAPRRVTKSMESERERIIEEAAAIEAKVAKKIAASHRSYVLAYRRRLNEWAEVNRSASPAITRATEAEVAQFFDAVRPLVEEFAPKLGLEVQPLLRTLFDTSAKNLAESIGKQPLSSAMNEASILISKRVRLVEGTLTTLSADVTDALAKALTSAEGFSVQSLTEAVQTQLEKLSADLTTRVDDIPARAQTIARTEVASVQGTARQNEMRALGLTQHRWVSEQNDATRDSHRELNGKVRTIGESFLDGVTLRWPGDPDAPVGEVANCRCACLPELPEDF